MQICAASKKKKKKNRFPMVGPKFPLNFVSPHEPGPVPHLVCFATFLDSPPMDS